MSKVKSQPSPLTQAWLRNCSLIPSTSKGLIISIKTKNNHLLTSSISQVLSRYHQILFFIISKSGNSPRREEVVLDGETS